MVLKSFVRLASLLIITQVIPLQYATAADGLLVQYDPNSSSGCVMFEFDDQHRMKAMCSATLVSSTEVMTAAHCMMHLSPGTHLEVRCGYQGMLDPIEIQKTARGNPLYVSGPRFQENADVASIEIDSRFDSDESSDDFIPNDFALIHLKSPLTQAPITPAFLQEWRSPFSGTMLHSEASCKMIGFGMNSIDIGGLPTISPLSGPQLTLEEGRIVWQETITLAEPDDIQFMRDHCDTDGGCFSQARAISHYLRQKGLLQFQALPGDSGSGVLCRNSVQEDWFMVGVMSYLSVSIEIIHDNLVEVFLATRASCLGDWTKRPMKTVWP